MVRGVAVTLHHAQGVNIGEGGADTLTPQVEEGGGCLVRDLAGDGGEEEGGEAEQLVHLACAGRRTVDTEEGGRVTIYTNIK